MILILAATDFEFAIAQQSLSAQIQNNRVLFKTTGIGMMHAAFSIAELLLSNNVDCIIQVGIAGSYDTQLPLGHVCAVQSEVIADLGVEEKQNWKDLFDMGFMKADQHPYTNAMLINPFTATMNYLDLPLVPAATVNTITTNHQTIQSIIKKYKPSLESMEGAALHYAGNHWHIPYLQIRSISNYVGERNKAKWNLPLALQHLNQTLIDYVNQLLLEFPKK